ARVNCAVWIQGRARGQKIDLKRRSVGFDNCKFASQLRVSQHIRGEIGRPGVLGAEVRCPLMDRMCCKTVFTTKLSNIDSRTSTSAQYRFKTPFSRIR